MVVAHISWQYGLENTGGAAIAATRLHLALIRKGIRSYFLCVHKRQDGPNVIELPKGFKRFLYRIFSKIIRCVWKFSPYRKSICLHWISLYGLEDELLRIKPDIVHVHWINADVLSFEQLAKIKSKVVLNLHDLYVINAIEPFPGSDKRYIHGMTRDNSSFLERWLFVRKFRSVHKLNPIFIGPSKWVCDCAKKSIIGKSCRAYTIPNIIDSAYKYNSEIRLPHDKFIILFGAYGGRKNLDKGFADLAKALSLLPEKVKDKSELWIFGEEGKDCQTCGVKTLVLGNVDLPSDLASLYNQADVFAFPSVQETQGMTKIEAMMCGLPVIAFDRTACPEGIIHGKNGWIAKDGDIASYARGIEYFFRNKYSSLEISIEARRNYSDEVILKRLIDVYKRTVGDVSNE